MMPPDYRFRVGSQSKTMVTTVLLQISDKGRLKAAPAPSL
ncbi:serine hydrolase [Nonomuraea phyllanthi]|uniref:Serine hydrolase n=1 Tax=Nonomuraea phyllanthi TaxID=2219224 RepID=A0A5C4UYZ4_9ACTN|nr:serine hydrolase [Nonomuraea phyllanthi]